ncbi:KAP family P-loop NTPase fold protein [Lacinutrix jangbogonensis]|uniref:KAP family P-loop NTPase fold protein n=1 Tax=Lacinutrix jangbogonensis TaxID=1469557 RepID=UPI00053DA071|nr:P-loop NTPase fold protein [Lacinutrix jangbogonensis]
MSENTHFLGDNPIERIEDDLFNFEHYALKVQQLIQLNSNDSNPLTIGIYGKWGEGKTSFLKLIENKIDVWKKTEAQKGILKYHFNPWRYSTEEEMLFDFFDGLAKTMFVDKNSNLQKVGKGILRFSKYLKAVKISASAGISTTNKISATFEPSEIFKALGEDFVGKDITLDKLKDKVNEALKVSNYKIVVFIDDIDRLDKDEIYTILKIVKLNGNFNNFIYLIPLDSEHVSKAISKRYGDEIKDGRFFLEKIINIPIHLPRIEEEDLKYFFESKFDLIKKSLFKKLKTNKEEEFILILYEFSGRFF